MDKNWFKTGNCQPNYPQLLLVKQLVSMTMQAVHILDWAVWCILEPDHPNEIALLCPCVSWEASPCHTRLMSQLTAHLSLQLSMDSCFWSEEHVAVCMSCSAAALG